MRRRRDASKWNTPQHSHRRYVHRWLAHHQDWAQREDLDVRRVDFAELLERRAPAMRTLLREPDDPAWLALDRAVLAAESRPCAATAADLAAARDVLGDAAGAFGFV